MQRVNNISTLPFACPLDLKILPIKVAMNVHKSDLVACRRTSIFIANKKYIRPNAMEFVTQL
jgi:hypothetical protein